MPGSQWWPQLATAVIAGWIVSCLAARQGSAGESSARVGAAFGFALVVVLVGAGFVLWVPQAGGTPTADTDLGTALMGGGIVAFAVLFVQQRFATEAETIELARQQRDDRLRAREQAQWLCAMREDLTGVDFSGRDLSGVYLRRKRLRHADLSESSLAGGTLTAADLSGAVMSGADLSRVHAAGALFRGAALDGATLTDANLAGADLRECDLGLASVAGARFEGADLRGAMLTDSVNLGEAVVAGAFYWETGPGATTWPVGFDPAERGCRIPSAWWRFQRWIRRNRPVLHVIL